MLKKKGDCKLEVDTWDLNIFCINNICSFPPLVQDDIIRSLQSRLDIICDEADEDPGPIGEDDREAIQPSEKPVSRLILCLLRFVKCSFCGVFGVESEHHRDTYCGLVIFIRFACELRTIVCLSFLIMYSFTLYEED